MVKSQPEQKLERFANRALSASLDDELSRAKLLSEAERRIGAQLSDQEKIAAADYVIDNAGELSQTERQVNKIYKELQQLAASKRLHSPA